MHVAFCVHLEGKFSNTFAKEEAPSFSPCIRPQFGSHYLLETVSEKAGSPFLTVRRHKVTMTLARVCDCFTGIKMSSFLWCLNKPGFSMWSFLSWKSLTYFPMDLSSFVYWKKVGGCCWALIPGCASTGASWMGKWGADNAAPAGGRDCRADSAPHGL